MKYILITGFLSMASMVHAQKRITLSLPVTSELKTDIPVEVKINSISNIGTYNAFYNPATKKHYPFQRNTDSTLLFILTDPFPRDGTISLEFKKLSSSSLNTPFGIVHKNGKLTVYHSGKPVLSYQTDVALPPPDSPSYYRRSGFIHPLYSPGGQILTDDFPVGHAHQHAVFHAWTSTSFRNRSHDFWNQFLQTGTIEHTAVEDTTTGPVYAQLKVNLRYKSLMEGEVLSEKWTIRIYAVKPDFIFDLELDQVNTSTDTLFLNKYTYGGMAFRGTSQWDHDNKRHFRNRWSVITSEGFRDSAANHTSARWVDASGAVDGRIAGVCVIGKNTNFRYPQKIRVHPQMPYWCYSPVIDEPFFIPPGGNYRASYRYLVHQGNLDPEKSRLIDTMWNFPVYIRL